MGNKITNEHIEDVYINFKDYYFNNKSDFLEKKQKHIVDEIKQSIISKNKFIWNDVSLTDYINNLVYMIKGKQFARVINKFSKEYFIKNICKDFDTTICENTKKSIKLHEIYYANVIAKNKAKISESNNEIIFEQSQVNDLENNTIKNIILYGSPGVGKTHNTKKLISLIERGVSEKEIFQIIKNNQLNDVVDIDDIKDRVKFVTFHQSFGYEDFIEGFRPNEEGIIELVDGVFKEISNKASNGFELYKNEKIGKYEIVYVSDEIIKIRKENGFIVPVPRCSIDELLGLLRSGKISLENLKDGRRIDLPSLVEDCNDPYIINGYGSIWYQLCSYLLEKEKSVTSSEKNYYLIIDEINRGNISKIFGELITLIEEDKRDTLEVILPYSKKPFKIPSNLYIIGTMNSTDKSIALIDIALRRRFTFLKMEPKSDLVKNYKAKNIMEQLNAKITDTLGADYVLGHSYFMKIEKDQDDELQFVLDYKITPLLEEYFYGDDRLDDVLSIIKNIRVDDTE